MKTLPFITFATALLSATFTHADTVTTVDGSRLQGEIVKIDAGALHLETSFAGTLEIAMSNVASFASDDPETLRLDTGEVVTGPINATSDGQLRVATRGGPVTMSPAQVEAAWTPGETDPAVLVREAEMASQVRKWSYNAAFALNGRSGNTESTDLAASFDATLEGPHDRLNFYLSAAYGEEDDGNISANEFIGGASYTNFFADNLGWYGRTELEYDEIEEIDFRSTSGLGLSYKFIDEEKMKLEGRAGFSYRFEEYTPGGSESFPGLDFGLDYFWQFAEWGQLNTKLSYTPSIDDFGDYRFRHTSNVDVPLALSDAWKLRLSLDNQYTSNPTPGRDKLDTTYAVSLLLSWK